MPDPRAGAVVYAKDVDRVSEFYAALLQVRPASQDEQYIRLETAAIQLVILAIPEPIARDIQISDPPQRRTQTPVKLVFGVDSIARLRTAAGRLGGQVDPPEREWQFGDDLVCDGCDPEGNVVQLRQRLR
jgi:predicted enzyme related to lactoylglutathione lyase